MTEKYIDLKEKIADELAMSGAEERILPWLLKWLDDHPDQVPGRTITESELALAVAKVGKDWRADEPVKVLMKRLGFTVVPEPTNAEKLASLMYEADEKDTSTISGGWEHVAEYLVEAGVKAPGADDDH